MADTELRNALHGLGIHEHQERLLFLLPLIQVAWADGEIQEAERVAVLRIAHEQNWVDNTTAVLLEGWLTYRPSAGYFSSANTALGQLIDQSPTSADVPQTDTVLQYARNVAEAAGGVFGLGTIEGREKAALEALAEALHVTSSPIDLRDPPAVSDWEDPEVTDVRGFVPSTDPPPVRSKHQGPGLSVAGSPALDMALHTPSVSIGRQSDNGLQLRGDAKVSRRHCQIHLQGTQWQITDSGSSQGTWVNGERVLSRPLFGGEIIQIGDYQIHFQK